MRCKIRQREVLPYLSLLGIVIVTIGFFSSPGQNWRDHGFNIRNQQKNRLTAITVWNGAEFKDYLHHFIYSAQLNEEVLDVLFLNRQDEAGRCLDFEKNGIDLGRTRNIHVACITPSEWSSRHSEFFCDKAIGWNCTIAEKDLVREKIDLCIRSDRKNGSFRIFYAYIFNDLLKHLSSSPYWAWLDLDMSLGNLSLFPFETLSTVSFLTFSSGNYQFMHGQMTSFNLDDENLRYAWKEEREFSSVDAFLDTPLVKFGEEKYWSKAYLRSEKGRAGRLLNWAFVPYDVAGDADLMGREDASFAISGTDILAYREKKTVSQIQQDILRYREIRQYPSVASRLRARYLSSLTSILGRLRGKASNGNLEHGQEETMIISEPLIDTVSFQFGEICKPRQWLPPEYTQCLLKHDLQIHSPQSLSLTYVRDRTAPEGLVYRHLEYKEPFDRKNIRRPDMLHYLRLKNKLSFPSFPIDETKIMVIRHNEVNVFPIRTHKKSKRNRIIYKVQKDI